MSIPYLVHKEDADKYDDLMKENGELFLEYRKLSDDLKIKCGEGKITNDELNEELSLYLKRYGLDKKTEEQDKKYNKLRIINIFSEQPKDLENYYTYFTGHRWGEAKNCRMMDIAHKGLKASRKALGKDV